MQENYITTYICNFCQFKWANKYVLGHYNRPKEEAEGKICPRCRVVQGEVPKEDTWIMNLRKFLYGKIDPKTEPDFEKWLSEHFYPKE